MFSIEQVAELVAQIPELPESMSLEIGDFSRRYPRTPPDVIPFAWTGGDGVHFGVLGDFGAVKDPADASVVCIDPPGIPDVTIVGHTLREFLGMLCAVKCAECFTQIDLDQDVDRWLTARRAEWLSAEDVVEIDAACVELKQALQLPDIRDPFAYLREAQRIRQAVISVETLDGLGIRRSGQSGHGPFERFAFPESAVPPVDRMQAFLKAASYDERLAFCRDAQHSYVFANGYDVQVLELVCETLGDMGLNDEADNLQTGAA